MSFCTDCLHFYFLQREKRLGRIEDQSFEDRRTPSRVSSLKRKPSDLKLLPSRDLVPRVSSARRDWTTKSPVVSQKHTATLSPSFSSSRKSETDDDSSCSTSPPSSPTMKSNARRIVQADLSQSAPFKSRSPLTSPPAYPQPLSSTSKEILKEDLGSWSSPTVKSWTRTSFQSNETSDFPLELSTKSTFEETGQTSPPSSSEPSSLSTTHFPSKEILEVDLHSWSSSTVKPRSRRTFQSDETSSSLVEFSVKSVSEENLQTSLPSSPKPPLPPKPTLPSKEIPNEVRDPSFSPTVKPWTRRMFLSDETPSALLELPIKSTSKETHQTSPPFFPEPFSSPKTTSPSKEIPQEDLLTRSRPIVKPRSRRSFQSDETLTSPLELPVTSTFEEPHQTSPPHSAKTPSSPKSLLLFEVADEVDGRPSSKPPLAPKPKLISSEVTPSYQPKKTSAPRLSPPVTRRFPAPTEPPPPPPEKHSPPESSPLAMRKDLLDLDGSDSNSPPTAQLISITEDDSASVHPAPAMHMLRPSSPQLGSLDFLQKEEGSGLFIFEQEVETKLKKTIRSSFYDKNP